VKVLRDFCLKNVDNFRREFDLLKQLRHSNIVAYLDMEVKTDNSGSALYIYQELVPSNASISSQLKNNGSFPVSTVQSYVGQFLEGLTYLHLNGILHLDIKGENVFVDNRDGRIKLADFGILKQVEACSASTQNIMRSSHYFKSPELFEGKTCSVKADSWSSGGFLYLMVSGQRPWECMNFTCPHDLLNHLKCHEGHPELPQLENWKDNDIIRLEKMIKRCFLRDPNMRPSPSCLLDHFKKFKAEENIFSSQLNKDESTTADCPTGIIRCQKEKKTINETLANTNFLSQNQVLVLGEEGQEIVVFNIDEFKPDKYACYKFIFTVFIFITDTNREMRKVELSIRSKTAESIYGIALTLCESIKGTDIDCVGIIDSEISQKKFESLKELPVENVYQQAVFDFFSQGLPFPSCIRQCSNPSAMINEHIIHVVKDDGVTSLLNQKVMMFCDAVIYTHSDALALPDSHDEMIHYLPSIFGTPVGILVEVKQCCGTVCSFQVMVADTLYAFKSLTCIFNCVSAASSDIIEGVKFSSLSKSICILTLTSDSVKSLIQRTDTDIEFERHTISCDIQDALKHAMAKVTFVDCSFEM